MVTREVRPDEPGAGKGRKPSTRPAPIRGRVSGGARSAAPIENATVPDPPKPSQSAAKEKIRKFWADPPWWVREGVLALVVALAVGATTVMVQKDIDDQRSNREAAAAKLLADQTDENARLQAENAQRLENQRFVRERSAKEVIDRPFSVLDLSGLQLGGLSLRGSDFRLSNLESTSFRDSQLQGADFAFAKVNAETDFTSADLTGAALQQVGATSNPEVGVFFDAVLVNAKLMGIVFTDIRAADLSGAMLYGADLSRIQELERVGLTGVCYDDRTSWPAGFVPPVRGNDDTCMLNHLQDFYGARGVPVPDFYFEPLGRLRRP